VVSRGTFRAAVVGRTVSCMKTFTPLFLGLLGWFFIAAMVLSTFAAPAGAPEREKKKPAPTVKIAPCEAGSRAASSSR
jgi:hypothetical protein